MARQPMFHAEMTGVEELRERLRSDRLFKPTRILIGELGRVAQKTAQRAAKPHPADKGTLGRAIRLEISADGKTALVFPIRRIVGIANVIEGGRRPGKRPPYKAIKRWALSHGIIPPVKGTKQLQELREDIKLRGTKGIHFMAQADEAVRKAMHEGIPRTERDIERFWKRAA